jgi:predicted dehydrogenase
VPTEQHYEVAKLLLENGVHVLIEKPIARTVEQGEELVRLADARGLILAVGHIERFNPVVVELRRRLREGMAGRIYQINAERLSPYPSRISDAGVVIDLASHDIDLLRYLTGEPVRHFFGETSQSINSDREDLFSGLLRFSNGVVGVLNVNWMTPQKVRRLTITAARGYFTCDLLSQQLYFYENETAPSQWDQLSVLHGVSEGNVLGIRIPRREPLAAELADFVQAVETRRPPTIPGREGVETLRIALGFLESASKEQLMRPQASS